MSTFDYGTENSAHFNVGDLVVLANPELKSDEVYKVMPFNPEVCKLFVMPNSTTDPVKTWMTVKRQSPIKEYPEVCAMVDNFVRSQPNPPLTGGKRKSRRRTHKRSKKARKSRSRYHH